MFCYCCVLIMISCSPTMKIAYNTDNLNLLETDKINNISLSVQFFEDIRSQSENNFLHLTSDLWTVRINNEKSCINSEVLYKKTPVGQQMSTIFAEHLSKKMPQLIVYFNQKEYADYYLEATVKYFQGTQKFSTGAAVGAQFGLIGALATAGAKTQGTIIIELAEVKVFDKQNNLIISIDNLRKEYEGEFPADANCYCIYNNMNQKLSEFNDDLISLLLMDMQNIK